MSDKDNARALMKYLGLSSRFDPLPEKYLVFVKNKLIELKLINIEIKSLPRLEFQELELLKLQFCSIEHLPRNCFQELVSIKRIYINNNNIQTLPENMFINMMNLEILDMSYNKLISIPNLASNSMLQKLFLQNNNIHQIKQIINPELRLINLSDNKIKIICGNLFSKCNRLTEINLLNNIIETISENAFNNSQLIKLNLAYNNIQKIHPLSFNNTTGLKFIFLNNNHIKKLPEKLFYGLKQLVRVNLSDNKILEIGKGVFSDCMKLEWLELKNNKINKLPNNIFHDLRSLIKLDLANNLINDLDDNIFSRLLKLKILALSHNNINKLPISMNKLNIWELYLSSNPLILEKHTIVGPKNVKEFISTYFEKSEK